MFYIEFVNNCLTDLRLVQIIQVGLCFKVFKLLNIYHVVSHY